MGFFSGAADELQAALVEQEARKRRAMLDAITLKDSQSRDEDRKANREIQRENLAVSRAAREEARVVRRGIAAPRAARGCGRRVGQHEHVGHSCQSSHHAFPVLVCQYTEDDRTW